MRVVFFLQGERVPAARARGMALAGWLEKQGIECLCLAPRPSVYGDTSWPWPLTVGRPLWSALAAVPRLGQLQRLRGGDVVFFQRFMVQLPTVAFERRVAAGHPSLFDFDDAIYLSKVGGWKLRQIAGLVDEVVAGNAVLAAGLDAPDKTTIIATAIDTDRWTPRVPSATRDVVVGWTGLASNYPQLAVAAVGIGQALRATGARFRIISNQPPPRSLRVLDAEYVPWRAASELADLQALDVGVMPLPDDPYARGKCSYKLLQYMALGLPGVASPVGMNNEVVRPGVEGFLPSSHQAWTEALVTLIGDPHLRARLGEAARARVVAEYSQAALFPRYQRILERLAR